MFDHIDVVKEYKNMLDLDKSSATIRHYVGAIEKFFSHLDIKNIDDIKNISASHCREYQSALKEGGMNPSSINSNGRALRAFFGWLFLNDYIDENPFVKVKKMKEPKREKARLTKEEVSAMMDACKNLEEKSIMVTLLSLGLRRSELVNLKVSDVNNDEVNIIGKGNKQRIMYFPDWAKDLIQEYLRNRKYPECEYLFCKVGKKYSGEAIRIKVKSIAKRAGIDDERISMISPHTMRRTLATNMLANGTPMIVIQGTLGHEKMSTTSLYAELGSLAVKKAMKDQESIV